MTTKSVKKKGVEVRSPFSTQLKEIDYLSPKSFQLMI